MKGSKSARHAPRPCSKSSNRSSPTCANTPKSCQGVPWGRPSTTSLGGQSLNSEFGVSDSRLLGWSQSPHAHIRSQHHCLCLGEARRVQPSAESIPSRSRWLRPARASKPWRRGTPLVAGSRDPIGRCQDCLSLWTQRICPSLCFRTGFPAAATPGHRGAPRLAKKDSRPIKGLRPFLMAPLASAHPATGPASGVIFRRTITRKILSFARETRQCAPVASACGWLRMVADLALQPRHRNSPVNSGARSSRFSYPEFIPQVP